MEALQSDKRYTYADYLTWDENIRCELIDGIPYMMSPAPSRIHQHIVGALFNQLYNFLKDKPCKAYVAPFDVRLSADKRDDTVLQPDILVVCDSEKLDDQGCTGAPDLVVEVLSSSSDKHDRVIKFRKYLEAGVREYWIVNPDSKTVNVYILENEKYTAYAYSESDSVPSHVLQGCTILLGEVFKEE
jgi:Uma2 family endonuclease